MRMFLTKKGPMTFPIFNGYTIHNIKKGLIVCQNKSKSFEVQTTSLAGKYNTCINLNFSDVYMIEIK